MIFSKIIMTITIIIITLMMIIMMIVICLVISVRLSFCKHTIYESLTVLSWVDLTLPLFLIRFVRRTNIVLVIREMNWTNTVTIIVCINRNYMGFKTFLEMIVFCNCKISFIKIYHNITNQAQQSNKSSIKSQIFMWFIFLGIFQLENFSLNSN